MTFKYIFLFGAGASNGAGSILPERPPLSTALYSELRRLYKGSWGALPDALADQFKNDFETGMQLLFDQHSQVVPQLMREMAIYFIQFRPVDQKSLYCKLVKECIKMDILQSVLFATLNYDCILEKSISSFGLSVEYFAEPKENAVAVRKLHGSSNMFCDQLHAGPGISYTKGVIFEGGLRAISDPDEVIRHCLCETALAPAMCLFMRGKPTAISPKAIQAVQKEWAEFLCKAEKIFLVGVRPHVPDTHIWIPIGKSGTKVCFIGRRHEWDNWGNDYEIKKIYLGQYFSSAFQSLRKELRQ